MLLDAGDIVELWLGAHADHEVVVGVFAEPPTSLRALKSIVVILSVTTVTFFPPKILRKLIATASGSTRPPPPRAARS